MNPRVAIQLVLLIFLIITQLPTMSCVMSHTPEGDIENASNSETFAGIESLIRCVTPSSIMGVIIFVGGEALAAYLDR